MVQENSNNVTGQSFNAEELRKYKELLDDGIITEDEFRQKKKQLLGL
ncbi:MAG: SHOCT domain-containing protein [Lachnospiraceae bacterium]|nr:SHOCT domain-containing protein [Lachnospiraceae bacterium]